MFLGSTYRYSVAGGGAPDTAATVSYVGRYRSQTSGTTHTITSDDIGSAEYVLLVFTGKSTAGAAVSSVSIGGNSATNVIGSVIGRSYWFIATAPVDTTPSIVITFDGVAQAVGAAVYGLTNLESITPTDYDSGTNSTNNLSVTTETDGVVVMHASGNDGPQFDAGSIHFTHEWYTTDDAEHIGWSQVAAGTSFSRTVKINSAITKGASLVSFR